MPTAIVPPSGPMENGDDFAQHLYSVIEQQALQAQPQLHAALQSQQQPTTHAIFHQPQLQRAAAPQLQQQQIAAPQLQPQQIAAQQVPPQAFFSHYDPTTGQPVFLVPQTVAATHAQPSHLSPVCTAARGVPLAMEQHTYSAAGRTSRILIVFANQSRSNLLQ